MKYPPVGTYSSLRGSGAPLLGYPDRIKKLARWDDVVIELATMDNLPILIDELKSYNPDIRLHAYVVMSFWENSSIPFFAEFAAIVKNTNGILLGTDGKPWPYTNVNIARTSTMLSLAKLIKDYADDDWYSIFIDLLIPAFHDQPDIGWNHMGYSSYKEFEVNWNINSQEFVRLLKLIGKPVTTNYGNGFPNMSHGNMRENFPHQFGGTWNTNMIKNGPQPGQLNLVYAEPREAWISSMSNGYDPQSPENLRKHRFGLASACLSGDFHTFDRGESDDVWCVQRLDFWYPEYEFDLGQPLGAARKEATNPLWTRMFEKGLVIVNPSTTPISMYFSPVRWKLPNGVVKDAINILGNDGLILRSV